jgi:tetratricopeptide (TPR) repeat protein
VALAPDRPMGHVALGLLAYRAGYDYETALRELMIAHRADPNNANVASVLATIYKRQGRWTESAAWRTRAMELDPLDPAEVLEMVILHTHQRRWEEARPFQDRLEAMPNSERLTLSYKFLFPLAFGRVDEAARLLRTQPVATWRALNSVFARMVVSTMDSAFIRRAAGEFPDTAGPRRAVIRAQHAFFWSEAAHFAGLADVAAALRDSLRIVRPAGLQARFIMAALGMKTEAVAEARRLVAERPVSLDAVGGPTLLNDLADVLMRVGEHEEALETLERVLAVPYRLTKAWLRIDPLYAPLRGNPRFERLVAEPGR